MSIKTGVICTILLVLFLCYAPNLPPHAEFTVHQPVRGRPLEGPLSPNSFLDHAERLHENVLIGPESIAFRSNKELFVGVYGGDIVKVYGKDFEKTQVVANNGPGCAGYWEEAICGRPLGMRFHSNGLLYVMDAYLGLFAVDVDTGNSTKVFDLKKPIEGVLPRFADDFDFDKLGNIYWSDASTVASLDNLALEIYASPSGRLIKYDVKTMEHKVLLKNLHFANGVQLSPKKDFVLVNELCQKRTLRYWLTGPRASTVDEFVSDIPGMPDNIRPRPNGGYYIAIAGVHNDWDHKMQGIIGRLPTLRRFLCRVTAIFSSMAKLIDNIFPNFYCKNFVYEAFNFHLLERLSGNDKALIVEVDENGEIIGSLHGSTGRLRHISEAQRIGDFIFFGSVFDKYLARIHIKDLKSKQKPKFTPEEKHEKYEL